MSNHSSSTLLLNPLKASISRAVYKASAAASLSLGLSLLFAGQASAQEAIDLADEDNRIGYSIREYRPELSGAGHHRRHRHE